jgi:hypothetical protein
MGLFITTGVRTSNPTCIRVNEPLRKRWQMSNGEIMIRSGKPRKLGETFFQCHFVRDECHMKPPGIEPETPR